MLNKSIKIALAGLLSLSFGLAQASSDAENSYKATRLAFRELDPNIAPDKGLSIIANNGSGSSLNTGSIARPVSKEQSGVVPVKSSSNEKPEEKPSTLDKVFGVAGYAGVGLFLSAFMAGLMGAPGIAVRVMAGSGLSLMGSSILYGSVETARRHKAYLWTALNAPAGLGVLFYGLGIALNNSVLYTIGTVGIVTALGLGALILVAGLGYMLYSGVSWLVKKISGK